MPSSSLVGRVARRQVVARLGRGHLALVHAVGPVAGAGVVPLAAAAAAHVEVVGRGGVHLHERNEADRSSRGKL